MITGSPTRPAALAEDAHKGDAGRVLVLAGCREMPGAALLCGIGALRGGAGLVSVASLDDAVLRVASGRPELIFWDLAGDYGSGSMGVEGLRRRFMERLGASDLDVVVAGPGLGVNGRSLDLLMELLGTWTGRLVLDADALNLLAESEAMRAAVMEFDGDVVLTPHPGEASRLLGHAFGSSREERRDVAGKLARKYGALVCLKGAGTWVADGRRDWCNSSGNAGMATAGAGDVLAGLLGALLCGASDVFEETRAGVHWHGLAGDLAASRLGQRALLASDIGEALGAAELAGPWA